MDSGGGDTAGGDRVGTCALGEVAEGEGVTSKEEEAADVRTEHL